MPRASRPALISQFDNRIPFLVDGTIQGVDKATELVGQALDELSE